MLGVFIKCPIQITRLVSFNDYPDDMPEHLKFDDLVSDIVTITFDELPEEIRQLPIYTFDNKMLLRICNYSFLPVEHEEIYIYPSV